MSYFICVRGYGFCLCLYDFPIRFRNPPQVRICFFYVTENKNQITFFSTSKIRNLPKFRFENSRVRLFVLLHFSNQLIFSINLGDYFH